MDNRALIAVVDDHASVRDAASALLVSAGYAVEGFASAEAFLRLGNVANVDCLVLDIGLPGLSGLALQRRLAKTWCPPTIFITGQEDSGGELRRLAQEARAIAFLRKPFDAKDLLHAIRRALREPPVRTLFLSGVHDVVMTSLCHPAIRAVIISMFALGFAGWLATFPGFS